MPPDLTFWLELVFKMAMTAAVVVFISIVVERSGPFLGSWWALLIGLCISIAWSGMLMLVRSKRMARIFRGD